MNTGLSASPVERGFWKRLRAVHADLDGRSGCLQCRSFSGFFKDMLGTDRAGLHRMLRLNHTRHLDLGAPLSASGWPTRRGGLLLCRAWCPAGLPGAVRLRGQQAFVISSARPHVELRKHGVIRDGAVAGATRQRWCVIWSRRRDHEPNDAANAIDVCRSVSLAEGLEPTRCRRPTTAPGRSNRAWRRCYPGCIHAPCSVR